MQKHPHIVRAKNIILDKNDQDRPYEELAISPAEVGLPAEGIELLEAVITEEPEVASHRWNLGVLYTNKGNCELAIRCYQETVSLNPGFSSHQPVQL